MATDKFELVRCKKLVSLQLGVIESVIKSIKEMNSMAELGLDISAIEADVIEVFEVLERDEKE